MQDFVIKKENGLPVGHPISKENMALLGHNPNGDVPAGYFDVYFDDEVITKSTDLNGFKRNDYKVVDGVVRVKRLVPLITASEDDARSATKLRASMELANTDFTQHWDAQKHIINIDVINTYRAQLRKLAIEMPAVVESWPAKPQTQWNESGVPYRVKMVGAKLALIQAGLIGSVDTLIDAIDDATERAAARAQWESSDSVSQDTPLVQFISQAMNLDDATWAQLWLTADSLSS